jgi:hypothetical protein
MSQETFSELKMSRSNINLTAALVEHLGEAPMASHWHRKIVMER